MPARPRPWSANELDALYTGIRLYGVGQWHRIKTDPNLKARLRRRGRLQLKDRYRNDTERRAQDRPMPAPLLASLVWKQPSHEHEQHDEPQTDEDEYPRVLDMSEIVCM
jgi:hypothetical protein